MQAGKLIATILRHDKKTASYKIALIRSINDLVLGYPLLSEETCSVAVPLRMLATFWTAYYWPFVNSDEPIKQGRQSMGKHDISFRLALTQLRQEWEHLVGNSRPSDGFFLSSELQTEHRRKSYPQHLVQAYSAAIAEIVDALQQPIRYAGPAEYSVFARPKRWSRIYQGDQPVTSVPGTQQEDLCVLVDGELWTSFHDLSLWIEALCIHEWCLFTQTIANVDRGYIYSLLTDRPDNRRPLTWERNHVEVLMMEGRIFECPWTGRALTRQNYDMDHLLPVSIYPLNEMWNIVPADREFNQHTKRNRIPSSERLVIAQPRLVRTYQHYIASPNLSVVLRQDAEIRFDGNISSADFPLVLAQQATAFLQTVAVARNLPVF